MVNDCPCNPAALVVMMLGRSSLRLTLSICLEFGEILLRRRKVPGFQVFPKLQEIGRERTGARRRRGSGSWS